MTCGSKVTPLLRNAIAATLRNPLTAPPACIAVAQVSLFCDGAFPCNRPGAGFHESSTFADCAQFHMSHSRCRTGPGSSCCMQM